MGSLILSPLQSNLICVVAVQTGTATGRVKFTCSAPGLGEPLSLLQQLKHGVKYPCDTYLGHQASPDRSSKGWWYGHVTAWLNRRFQSGRKVAASWG